MVNRETLPYKGFIVKIEPNIFRNPSFSSAPALFAAWPGMGGVGIITMEYLRNKLGAKAFAEIDLSNMVTPESLSVKNGLIQLPAAPVGMFYAWENPPLIIFESNAHVEGPQGMDLLQSIVQLGKRFEVPQIYTAAALAQSMHYADQSQVLYVSNNERQFAAMKAYGILPLQEGYLAGLNGLMLAAAHLNRCSATCLLGTMPSYAVNISYPKAPYEIAKVIAKIINVTFNFADFETNIQAMDQLFSSIEGRIRQLVSSTEEKHEEISEMEEEKVPQYIMDKIENLFREVAKDKSKATELKGELDRWNLYDLYEKRFLDLFKPRGNT